MEKRKKALIGTGVIVLALIIELLIWLNNGKGAATYPKSATLQSLQPTYDYGYIIDENHYTPDNNDPQLGFSIDPVPIESVVILFQQPLAAKTMIKIYYAQDGQTLSEDRAIYMYAYPGAEYVVVDLPAGDYKTLRVDINGEFDLEEVQISDVDPYMKKGTNDYLQLGFEIILILLAAVYLWHRFFRFKQKEGALENRGTTRRCEKLKTAERWYVLVCFVICFTWSCVFLNSATYGPDEPMRYSIPRYIYETGTLPYGDEPSLIDPVWGFSYGFCIVLPYLISAFFMRVASFYVSVEFPMLIAARLTSTLSYTATAFFAIRIGKRCFSDYGKWIFALIMTLTPQLVFLGSYVNNDSFALLSAVMIIDCWMECLPYDFDRRSSVRLAVSVSLCLLSYKLAYGYVLATFLLYCYWYVRNHKRIKFSYFIKNGLMILGVVFILTGWHFIRNAILYDGDFLATWAHRPTAELYALPEYKPSQRPTYRHNGYSIIEMLQMTPWFKTTLQSMVSYIGYMSLYAKPWVYNGFIWLFTGGAFFALVRLFWPGSKLGRLKYGIINFMLLMVSVIAFCLSIYSSWTNGYQPQGRYVIYAYPCVALLAASGYNWLAVKLKERFTWGEPLCLCIKCTIIIFLSMSLLECFLHGIRAFLM